MKVYLRKKGYLKQLLERSGSFILVQSTTCFCVAYKLRIVFTLKKIFLIKRKKILRKTVFCDMWKLHEIQISVFINKVDTAMPICLHMVYGCFAYNSRTEYCNRVNVTLKA